VNVKLQGECKTTGECKITGDCKTTGEFKTTNECKTTGECYTKYELFIGLESLTSSNNNLLIRQSKKYHSLLQYNTERSMHDYNFILL